MVSHRPRIRHLRRRPRIPRRGVAAACSQDDLRDAAEKAWCATKRATDALILARTGVEPEQSPDTSRGLVRLARVDGAINPLIGRYYSRQGHLHGTCFYLGECEPVNEVERRIRETVDYVDDAARLAGFSSANR